MKEKSLIILTLICLIGIRIDAQGIDTLWKDNPSISDSAKLELLGATCYDLIYTDTARSRSVCEEMLRLTPGCNNTYARANAYRTAGIVYQDLFEFGKAFENYNLAINLLNDLHDDNGRILYGKALSNIGLLYHENGDFQTALRFYFKADSLLEPFELQAYKINLYSKIGNVYDHLNQDERRIYYNKKLFKLAEFTHDERSMVTSCISYSQYAMHQQKYDSARFYLMKGLDLAKESNNPEFLFSCYFNLCENEYRQDHYTEALAYLKKSEEIAREWGDIYRLIPALLRKGYIYLYQGRFNDALSLAKEGIALSRENRFDDLLEKTLDLTIMLEDTLGNYKSAMTYYKEYIHLLNKRTDEEVRKTINFLDARYQAEKREVRIANLESQQKLNLLRISRNRLWIILLVVLLSLLGAASILMSLNYRYKKKIALQEIDLKKQKIIELEKERQLVAANAALRGEESERSRLARDLHDGLGGLLSGLKFRLNDMKGDIVLSDESVKQFDRTLGLLDNSIKELRRVAHNLMPEALIKFGLKDALNDFCSGLNTSDIEIKYRFHGEHKRIDQSLEIVVYRIVQELVNNALKHSGTKLIVVQIMQDENRLSLAVQDSGKGFDLKSVDAEKSLGLSSIKSRVAAHKGTIDIHTEPGKGTEIQVEFNI
jgi:two-component system, NarL family, sensor kinase